MKKKLLIVLMILIITSLVYATTRNIVPRADGEGGLGTSSKSWLTAYIDTIFTNILTLTDQNASPDAVGELQYDNTVANWDDGALCWYDDDEVKYLIDLATLPTNDDAEVCVIVGDDDNTDMAHFCNWREVVPRRGRKKDK